MREILYLSLFYGLKFVFGILPKRALFALLKLLSKLYKNIDKRHTKVMRANLKMCFKDKNESEIETLIAQTYFNFGLFGAEFLLNENDTKEQILAKTSFENQEILLDALSTNRPIIVQTAHYGNWELFSLAMAARFGAVSIIGRALDSKAMNRLLERKRTRFDIELIEKKGAAKPVIKALKEHRLLGILVDQNTGISEGLECSFFGHKIIHTHAASVFASKMDALIIPAFIQRDGERFKIVFYDKIDVSELSAKFGKEEALKIATQAQSDATQKQIAKKPDEYFWMHRKFKYFYKEIYA